PQHTKLDPLGATLSIIGLVALVYAIIEAPTHGWLAGQTVLVGTGGLVALALFVWWELRAPHPMLDMSLFKRPAFGISSLSLTLVFFALMGMFFSMSMLLQLIFGYSPLEAAVRMLPVAGTMMVGAPLSTKFVERFGKRKVVAVGMLTVAVGTLVLSAIGVDSAYSSLVVGMVILAFGMSVAMSPTTDLLMSSVPRNRAGMGSAMNDTTRELGGALGIAVLGSILASRYSADLAPAITHLPEAARMAADQSLAGAMVVGQQLGGQLGAGLIDAAQHAWINGYQLSLHVGAALIALAAVVAYLGLPDRADDHDAE
ncbi:MFS transporter, partial [Candidatus Saccharibacteria bacterium]|nr:MFS transporter [Candidatus Saccharibacteria bacterium]